MAAGLLFYEGGALAADLVRETGVEHVADLSSYPIERGAVVTDHTVLQPRTLTLSLTATRISRTITPVTVSIGVPTRAVLTDQQTLPVATRQFQSRDLLNLSRAVQSAIGRAAAPSVQVPRRRPGAVASRPTTVQSFVTDGGTERLNAFHQQLLTLLTAGTLVVAVLKDEPWPDMVITSVKRTDPQNAPGQARFEVTLREVRTVETAVVTLPALPSSKRPVSAKADAQEITDEQRKAQTRSVAAAAVDAGAGAIKKLFGGGA